MRVRASTVVGLIVAGTLLATAGGLHAQSDLGNWQKITAIPDAKTHLVPRTWTLDKYPDAPTLTPHSKVTILDQDGPGVVTNFHVSNYAGGDASRLHLRVWYDRQDKPAIDMPLMDFLGDVQAAAKPYHTIYFSRVRASHNFRLPMPFQKHIRIEVENPTDRYLMGYMEVQWDEVNAIPKESGYLRTVYRQGTFKFPARGTGAVRHPIAGHHRRPFAPVGRRSSVVCRRPGDLRSEPRNLPGRRQGADLREPGLRGFLRSLLGFPGSRIGLLSRPSSVTKRRLKVEPWPQWSAPATRTRSRSRNPA